MQGQKRPLPSLKRELQALAARRQEPYAQQSALLVRWGLENTNANDDVATMYDLLHTNFGISPQIMVIPRRGTANSTWELVAKILEIQKTHNSLQQPSLFILYYAGGSGVPVEDGSLQRSPENEGSDQFALEDEGKYILWSTINEALSSEDNKALDVLVILDCAFGGNNDLLGTTEILAACRGTFYKRDTIPISFTQRIWHAVRLLKANKKSIKINDLLATLESQDCTFRPFHTSWSGKAPIMLTFKQEPTPSAPVRALPTTQSVIVKLTVPDTTDGSSSFRQAIRELPENMKVDVLDAYEED
ncbi:hypothetical protein N7540_005090 [Penicillium herquei]|nr:hypothetical protein N7540_005090 [Penicillium herquei]